MTPEKMSCLMEERSVVSISRPVSKVFQTFFCLVREIYQTHHDETALRNKDEELVITVKCPMVQKSRVCPTSFKTNKVSGRQLRQCQGFPCMEQLRQVSRFLRHFLSFSPSPFCPPSLSPSLPLFLLASHSLLNLTPGLIVMN